MKVAVFGSVNMDMVVHTSRIPGDGETLIGDKFILTPGGKAATRQWLWPGLMWNPCL